MDTFWKLFKESVIMSGFITISCISVMLFLVATGQPVPDILSNTVMIVVGFFFGGKLQQAASVDRTREGD